MRVLRNIILAAFLMGTLSFTVNAEYSVGFAAGGTRGAGATFRSLPEDTSWGWQVTGLPLVHPDGGVVSLGAQAVYVLHKSQTGMAYATLGGGTVAMWDNCTEEDSKDDIFCEDESNWGVGLGPGLGFELRMVDNLAFALDVPLAVLFVNEEFHGILPVPNLSLMYYW